MSATETSISLPAGLLPKDGRFGSGPSKVRQEAISALFELAPNYLGTSHRQKTVRDHVSRLRNGLSSLFQLPADWEVILGNGGTTLFWDAASFGLIESVSQHLAFGEFSSFDGRVFNGAIKNSFLSFTCVENIFSSKKTFSDPFGPVTVTRLPCTATLESFGNGITFFPNFDIKIPYKLFLRLNYF